MLEQESGGGGGFTVCGDFQEMCRYGTLGYGTLWHDGDGSMVGLDDPCGFFSFCDSMKYCVLFNTFQDLIHRLLQSNSSNAYLLSNVKVSRWNILFRYCIFL